MKQGLDLILPKLAKVIANLSQFAMQHKDLPTLGYTHHQVAQPITVGKRAAQWTQDLLMDLEDAELVQAALLLRGAQGTTGTQASFLEIFHGDGEKIDQLNTKLCEVSGRGSLCQAVLSPFLAPPIDWRHPFYLLRQA